MRRRPHRRRRHPGLAVLLLAVLVLTGLLIGRAGRYCRETLTELAVAESTDAVTLAVNLAVTELLAQQKWQFITLERDAQGRVCAIGTDVAQTDAFAAALLERIAGQIGSSSLEVSLPLGNLTGLTLLVGRGPRLPVRVTALTSPRTDFHSSLTATGINQSCHRITLEVTVHMDVLAARYTAEAEVPTRVLLAETVLLGEVPETYLEMKTDGYSEGN